MATKTRTLLSTNAKLEKPVTGHRFHVVGLSLAPANHSGREVCPARGACADACVLWFAGRTVMPATRNAAIERTRFYFEDRHAFITQLCDEIRTAARKAWRAGATLAVRLNTASDIVWERVAPGLFDVIQSVGAIAYDYTKFRPMQRCELPACYSLTHSVHERTTHHDVWRINQHHHRNLALVIDAPYNANGRSPKFGLIPAKVIFRTPGHCDITLDTVDGDDIGDVRHEMTDGHDKCVILRGKGGRARVREAVAAGFAKSIRPRPDGSGWSGMWSGGYEHELPGDGTMRRPGSLVVNLESGWPGDN